MLANLIMEKIPLIKMDNVYFGQCPHCSSKTFMVDDETNRFECFSCQAQGGYSEFSYLLGDTPAPIEIPIDDFKSKVFEANKEILNAFVTAVNKQEAQEYIKTRNISFELISLFNVGYSDIPLFDIAKKYSNEVLLATGAFKLKDNRVVPMFYKRLMFPIYDSIGNIVGWGGRKIENSSAPKYINSAESVIYQKRNILFGMNLAKEHLQNGALICEGYMDVASLHANGFNNAVASLGTALTPNQLEMLRAYTDTLYLCYDNDGPGLNAAKRAIELAKHYNFIIKIISMADYKDADEYMNNDAEAFKKCIENALSLDEFIRLHSNIYNTSELLNLLITKKIVH